MPRVRQDGGMALRNADGRWMRRLLFPAMALAFANLGAIVHADPEPGSLIDRDVGSVGAINGQGVDVTRRVINTYGRCVARNRSRLAETILALPLRSDEQEATVRRVLGGEDGCLGTGDRTLRLAPPLVVGAMAEWFVADRYDAFDLPSLSRISDERFAEIGLAPRNAYEDFALCVVHRAPLAVRALVETEPAGSGEETAFARLTPHLGPCLPQAQTLAFNRATLRAYLAVGLYRALSVTASATAMSSSEQN